MKTTSYNIFYLLFQFTFFTLLLGAIISVGEKVMGLASDGEEKYSIATYLVQKLKKNPEIVIYDLIACDENNLCRVDFVCA